MIATEERWCTLCGPNAGKKEVYPANFSVEDLHPSTFSARRSPDRRHFRLVECQRCGIIFSDPSCPPEQLDTLYARSLVTYGPQEEQIYESYAPILDRAVARSARRTLFAEVGGGAGFMLRYGAEAGFAAQVEVEPSADAERKFVPPSAHATFIRSTMTTATLKEGTASLVCFFQMLDHLRDPLGFLKTVHAALEPGGVAVCVTHDSAALTARLLGEASPIYDVEHTYLFNAHNLREAFEAAGFTGIETFPVANDYSMKYWLHLAPLPAGFKRVVRGALERVGIAELRLKLRMGNVGVIAQKPEAA